MQAIWTLMRRELGSYFVSFTGYMIIAGVALLVGLSFWDLLDRLEGDVMQMPVTELFFSTYWFWSILLLTVPVITMRLFALEKFSGTFETLMTTPVTDTQVVIAKFLAALVFYMLMWLPLAACIFVVRHYTSAAAPFDAGVFGCTFLGIFLLGCVFVALGCFSSALTRSQVMAAVIALVLSFGLFLVSFLASPLPGPDWKSQALSFLALPDQMRDFARGVVDTRAVVLYVTATFLFLLMTLRVIESRRWK